MGVHGSRTCEAVWWASRHAGRIRFAPNTLARKCPRNRAALTARSSACSMATAEKSVRIVRVNLSRDGSAWAVA
jgi:hypothetical protein